MVKRSTQSREGVKGGLRPFSSAPCGVQRQSLWWGLGQRPNCSSSDQFKRNSQQRRRQRSVPASNFARPQTRPQAALPTTCALPRHMGATDPIFHAAPNNLRGVLAFAAGVVYNHSRAMNGSDAGIAPGKRVRGGGRRMGSGRVIPTGSCGQSPPVRLRERTQERGQGANIRLCPKPGGTAKQCKSAMPSSLQA